MGVQNLTYASALAFARLQCHDATQWPSLAARANLESLADDSHTNLSWNRDQKLLVSHPISISGDEISVGVRFSPLQIEMLIGSSVRSDLTLAGRSDEEISAWLDDHLESVALKPVSGIALPYEWATGTHKTDDRYRADPDGAAALHKMGELFAAADTLIGDQYIAHLGVSPGPSPVRCWPHHFDMATLVSFDGEAADTDRSIGIGFSPGDGTYAVPYFYVAPWPHPEMRMLPDLSHGHWHTEGFLAGVYTLDDPAAPIQFGPIRQFFAETTATWRQRLDL